MISTVTRQAAVGGDLIASLSMGLYSNPLDVYRELVQNSTDACQVAGVSPSGRRIDIRIDHPERKVVFRDYAIGLSASEIANSLFAIGNSRKRGQNLRGFRGLGRLAALGHCRKLIFRSRKSPDDPAWELCWDSFALHQYLGKPNGHDIGHILEAVSTISPLDKENGQDCFFECELQGVRAGRNDVMLDSDTVSAYLSEIAPVGFRDDFSFAGDIRGILGGETAFEVKIYVNDSPVPLARPHADQLVSARDAEKVITTMDRTVPISEFDDGFETMARGWVLHHDYPGALPQSSNIRGLRIRIGNIQIGDERIFEHIFREPRFNSWCIGEIHIIAPEIRPNTRRDNLELSPALEDFENSLRILTRKLSVTCRSKSAARNKRAKASHQSLSISRSRYREIARGLRLKQPLPDRITLSWKARTGDRT